MRLPKGSGPQVAGSVHGVWGRVVVARGRCFVPLLSSERRFVDVSFVGTNGGQTGTSGHNYA
jgi:hypothetical protein